jgi:dolichol-phosphate mannosyltransferase
MIAVSLIIPTYNEAKNLPLLLEEIDGLIDKSKIDLEYIIVDDNSPDGTGAVAENLKKRFPLRVIHRAGKLGLGSAVIEGFKLSTRNYLGVMDADLSHDPEIINKLILSLAEYDLAAGSRFEVESAKEWNWHRKILAHSGAFLARTLTRVKDPLSGYFFLNKRVIDGVDLNTKGYKILLEILVKGDWRTVKEIPYTFRFRRYSVSKLNYEEYLLFVSQLIKFSSLKIYKQIRRIINF